MKFTNKYWIRVGVFSLYPRARHPPPPLPLNSSTPPWVWEQGCTAAFLWNACDANFCAGHTDWDLTYLLDRFFLAGKMTEVEGVQSVDNPNESWVDSKGVWLTYVLMIVVGHLVILSIPFFDTPIAWTLTNNAHNLVNILFHYSFALIHCLSFQITLLATREGASLNQRLSFSVASII